MAWKFTQVAFPWTFSRSPRYATKTDYNRVDAVALWILMTELLWKAKLPKVMLLYSINIIDNYAYLQ